MPRGGELSFYWCPGVGICQCKGENIQITGGMPGGWEQKEMIHT